ncbi:tetratricopeptide repeat protein [Pleurocapsales cyanobacterium LEGE 06147]|nr:tetratricopeptide repeat protein [Pleurocapsales cyanobacterium LEGE 06147]
MVSENQEQFRKKYQAGKEAFERGQYSRSVQYLREARELIARSSRLGGEVQIWLLTAYQAAGKQQEAIALGQELFTHPHPQIRKQAKSLLYIIQAPQLKRPKEWMTQIPDFSGMSDSNSQYVPANNQKKDSSSKKKIVTEVDVSQVNTQDNRFVWIALIITMLILGGLVWLN